MDFSVIIVQIALGILLFFIINFIGKHSYSIGYMEISMFAKVEESPALNFLIRVLSPIVYIIIISAVLYSLDLDKFVRNIFYINIYYIIFRLFFNIITNRGLLLNWYRQCLYWVSIISISYITYENLIKVKKNILPDFTTVANELWIIILIFLFQITNNMRLSQDSTARRKDKYLTSRYNYFAKKYNSIISNITRNEILEAIVYAILIYEDFNRPKIIRMVENLNQKITRKPHTLGVMQVKSPNVITDEESVIRGSTQIIKAYNDYINELKKNNGDFYSYQAYDYIVSNYNGGISYQLEVTQLISKILEKFYPATSDTLDPEENNKSQ